MWSHRAALFISGIMFICALPQLAEAEMLISETEAKLPSVQDTGMVTRGLTRGPVIELLSPAAGMTHLKSPVSLKIKFIGRNNVAIDLASVRLTYLKIPLVDLTDRIKAFLTGDGIEMVAAEVPPGIHILRLDLKDAEGRASSSTITLSVESR